MKLSIVATLYRSAAYVREFHERASAAARKLVGEGEYEIVLVNDGSPDNSLQLAVELAGRDPHLVVVDLSRNFGHHKAMMTGLDHARGERIFLIDSDLEEAPEYLTSFAEQMDRESCDVVYGVQGTRKGGWFERCSGYLFWKLIAALSGLPLPANVVTARLMTRQYVDALLLHDEREVFMAGLWFITGFDQRAQTVHKLDTSESTYTMRRRVSLLVNSVTSFSNLPLVAIFYVGLVILALACCYIAFLVLNWFFLSTPVEGWTSVVASVWLLGGLIVSFMGVIGIYLSKIYSEAKRRPYTVVKRVYGNRQD
ncbi:glycosyltransferase family 2 protein [Lacisediminimonas profundi]|uniref:glycosyltransferase family 2 protein n=1 Tax=Lacisediminimonas profundi TaxID=2603856 RepID=UPI00124BB852|nr:glycosyltransferase family 2 protein [Lacisediminimonas profundi]